MQSELSKAVDTSKGIPMTQEEAFAGAEPARRQWKNMQKLVGPAWVDIEFDEIRVGDVVRDAAHPDVVRAVVSDPAPCADSDGAFRGNMAMKIENIKG